MFAVAFLNQVCGLLNEAVILFLISHFHVNLTGLLALISETDFVYGLHASGVDLM